MSELRTWPQVTERAMFGLQAFYRAKDIFTALPKTKAFGRSSFIFKLHPVSPAQQAKLQADPRIDMSESHRWIRFELTEESDISPALAWLQLAYEKARTTAAESKKRR